MAEIPVGLEPVSVNAWSNDEAWVVNEVSDSVSIVSVSRQIVTDTLHAKDEPADVAFAGGRAFVSVSRRNEVRVFDVASHAPVATLPLLGSNPRALAVSADGTKVYAAFALSGNRTTLVPDQLAPPQPPATGTTLAPPRVGLIVDAEDTNWSSVIEYTLPDHDVVEIDAASLTVNRYFSRVGTINFGLAVQPGSGDLFVANTDARNLVRFEPELRGHAVDNRVTHIAVATGQVTTFDLNPGINYSQLPNPASLATALAQPTAVVCDPAGGVLYVAAFGTDRVAVVDTEGTVLARIEVGPVGTVVDPRNKRGPRGLALHPVQRRLYVLNRIANTISILDTGLRREIRELPVGSHDPTPAVIRYGRGFLYDAKLSGNGTMACATCHVDGDMDMLAWDLGDPGGPMQEVRTSGFLHLMHPMKGPMLTQTLRGLKGEDPLHWRGDRRSFMAFNAGFDRLLGGPMLSDFDMETYRNFIETIVFAPNPNQNLDRSLPTAFAGGNALIGQTNFNEVRPGGRSCAACHRPSHGTGSEAEILPGLSLGESQPFNIAHLRNIYQRLDFNKAPGARSITGFGLTHDGVEPDIPTMLSRHGFQDPPMDTETRNNLSAFLQCFDTGMAPAVGYTRTLTSANVGQPEIIAEWALLEDLASRSQIDLILRGTVRGLPRGLLYQPALNNYLPNQIGLGPFTRAQLAAQVASGDTLSLTGVPPGSGLRMGLDRDLDGVLDGDIPSPVLGITRSGAQILVSWPVSATGFVLEVSGPVLGDEWKVDTTVREVVGGRFQIRAASRPVSRFYRLRNL
jgi:DNA-binding beta-propeller fold protein YncE